ncbi:MAG: GTP-binding protein [Nanoarchaeota archaeon]|nr:GTP-binding protein [Nanoarchaeota archaeon]MBU1005537.1 GTP-binding protein [Nanoarchaeota archaeon]MBU1946596.1 GTP-binding protein [Nanoarchaeota archaeon]
MTSQEKIKDLEDEISSTKYNKKTQHAIGLMKAKLAMMKERATQRASVGKAKGDDRFAVRRTGDGTVVLLGFPSVGKSTLLNKITNAKSDIASYAFTTLRAIPGLMEFKHAKIQIIDVPGIVSGAASGHGRGKEVMGMLRSADLILILVDALFPEHYEAILKEINETGIRVQQEKPEVRITKKERGGITIGATVRLTKIDQKTIVDIAREMRINNADFFIKSDIDADQLIDVIEGNRVYTKSLTVISKIDLISEQELKRLKGTIKPDVVVSAATGEGTEELKEKIYDRMRFMRIFLKEANKQADMKEPLIMFKDSTIKDVCEKLHRDFVEKFRFARLWGSSAKFGGQVFRRLDKELEDNDILELHIS